MKGRATPAALTVVEEFGGRDEEMGGASPVEGAEPELAGPLDRWRNESLLAVLDSRSSS